MKQIVTATEARVHFGEIMRRAADEGQTIIVERNGMPQVAILSVAEYERLQASAQRQVSWQEQVQAVRERVSNQYGVRSLPASEEIIREMREERDGWQDDLR